MVRWFRFMLRNRLAVSLGLVLVTALAAWSTSRAVLSSSLQQLFFGESADYAAYLVEAQRFGSDEAVVVGYADPDPLSPESLARLQAAVDAIQAVPEVADTHSLLDAARVHGADGTLTVETWADLAREAPERSLALAEAAARDPRAGGLFIDKTGRVGGAIVAELTIDPDRSGEAVPAIRDAVERGMLDAGYRPEDLHLAGLPVVVGGLVDESFRSIALLFPITCVVLGVTVLALFGRLAPAAVSLGVSLVATLWTMGFAALLDPRFSIFTAIVPAFIVIVAFSDIIHLWSAYLTELRHGRSKADAILESAADVGKACLLTSATTFVGFVSLSFIPTPAFRLMGVTLGFGVGVALLLAVTIVPIVLSVLPTPPLDDRSGRMARLVDAVLDACERSSVGRPWAVIGGFAAFAVAAGLGMTRLRIDADFVDRFAESSRIHVDADWFAEHFAGTDTVDVFITAPEGADLLDDGTWAGLADVAEAVAAMPGVDHVTSATGVVDEVHAALGGAGLPRDRATVSQELLLFEAAGGSGLDRLLDFERRRARLTVRLGVSALREMYRIGEDAGDAALARLPPGTEALSASLSVLLGGWIDEILAGQRRGVGASVLIIGGMMMLGLRSVWVGGWSMVPNLLPLLALGGFTALVWDPVDSDMLSVAMLAIGIGVDDTVHFLMRYRLEADRTDDNAEAIRRTFAFAGRAIVTTTVILGLGFLPLLLATYKPLRMFGMLLPMVFGVALVADLLLVPALARVGLLRFPKSTT